jgi:uncharacterized protein YndB with AHSA1/START domain
MISAMLLRHEIVYDAPMSEVFAMLSDPEFRQRSAEAMGVISADVSITPKGAGISVRIDQVQPAGRSRSRRRASRPRSRARWR